MKHAILSRSRIISLWLGLCCCSSISAKTAPAGFGQLETAPSIIPGGTDDQGRKYSYLGQQESGGKLTLTASNGFFDHGGITAGGTSPLPKVGDEELIPGNFEYLEWKQAEHSMRWHLLTEKSGKIYVQVHLDVTDPGSKIEVKLGKQIRQVLTSKSGSGKPQPWKIVFDVQPGEHQLSLEATASAGSGQIGKLHRIDLYGPGIEKANLLRVRWRPAAAHGGYDTSVPDAKLLVFTTRSTIPISSYSPITTPFGYFGTGFSGDQRSGGWFNFSMWGKGGAASDLRTMPHLLGVGSPDGEFSGFGHEGTGVKPRGWLPMPDKPKLVVQALRVENGEHYDTYYGYYFDHPTKAWKYFTSGRKWHAGKPISRLKLGSFCEVPGPPARQRTGDIYREVRRRGWAWNGKSWLPIEKYSPGGSGSKGEEPVNKSWYTSADGEYAMGCGGIRLYEHDRSQVKPSKDKALPDFLINPTIKSVFTTPIVYGEIQVTEVSSDQAQIEFELSKGAKFQDGVIYFGTKDALTFARRKLHGTEKGSDLSKSVSAQTWQNQIKIETPIKGLNQITLKNLKPATTYYYRILINNSVSRIWNNETHSFTTPVAGESAIKEAATRSIRDQPNRVWTYRAGTQTQKVEGRLIGISKGTIQIERKSDGKKGTIKLEMLSEADQEHVRQM